MTINHSTPVAGSTNGHEASTSSPPAKQQHVQEPVAIIGMGCRLPGDSNSPYALANFLKQCGIAENAPPESRFSLSGHHDGSKKPKTMRSPGGMFLENVDPREFDAQFFEIPRTDAIAMDPQQRQLLEVVYECLENSGVTLQDLNGARVGCFVGSYAVDYADMQARDPEDRAPSVTIGVGRAILSNRISHFLNIKGPSMTIDTACSGSLVAVDVACRYLHTGEIDGAIVAAANLYLSPEHNMDVGPMKGASSLSGKCHTFDVKADGYIKAEAVNAVMLKRLKDAIRDGDPIRSVILGTATNSDGSTPGIASPSSAAQAEAIRSAYANAGISNFNDTTYLECHGTGTQAGDPTEVSGVATVFKPGRSSEKPLIIGSIKSNIGHSEPAAGISGLLKAILAVENKTIFGNPTFITPNPKIDFKDQKVFATRQSIPWPKDRLLRASVNSFGYGGSNAHVVIEDPARFLSSATRHKSSYLEETSDIFSLDDSSAHSQRPYVLCFSANDEASLRRYIDSLKKHLINPNVSVKLQDLAYTLSERRTRHFHRSFLITNSISLDTSGVIFGKKSPKPPKIGYIFTGQGAQWSQMGKMLVESFPQARALLVDLDKVLQTAVTPPAWSLLEELSEQRSPELLRQPEFSQPLCTALQLAILSVLEHWGISPHSVAGHSSGEIAAAYAAGYLTKEDAIKVAFYRGLAAKELQGSTDSARDVGMMAVGLGSDEVLPFIEHHQGLVHIACFNGPKSVTLSGKLNALEKVRREIVSKDHFARFLQVNLAYHSIFMNEIGERYAELLQKDFTTIEKANKVDMYSSVFGAKMGQAANAVYWKRNMTSPVRFEQAVQQMLSVESSPDFLIEIGPSGALAAVVTQIKKNLPGSGASIQYCAAWSRGPTAINSLLGVAGCLYISGDEFQLKKVNLNQVASEIEEPSFIVDLPNYAWNHSTQYWYESEASKDWRNRLFAHHDLLGTKILGTSWHAPSFRKTLKLEYIPWLRDHKMGSEIVFPAAGFISMAIEAISQCAEALQILEGKLMPENHHYKLRDVTFPRALVLEEESEAKIMLSLNPLPGSKDSWYEFTIRSLSQDIWHDNCHGLVRLEQNTDIATAEEALKPLVHPVSGQLWYKAMHDVGYNFGPNFQKHLEVESISGKHKSRSLVSLTHPEMDEQQSVYPMHPVGIDGCFQSCAPSLWKGNRPGINAVLIPAIIDELSIYPREKSAEVGLAITSAKYVGLGLLSQTKNFMSDASVYDATTGSILFGLSGLRYHVLETQESIYDSHSYSRTCWRPDISLVTNGLALGDPISQLNNLGSESDTVSNILDLVAHKLSDVKVLEAITVNNNAKSYWLEGSVTDPGVRAACRTFQFISVDPMAVLEAEEKYGARSNTNYSVLDISSSPEKLHQLETGYDLIIIRTPSLEAENLLQIAKNARAFLSDRGFVLLLQENVAETDVELSPLIDGIEKRTNNLTESEVSCLFSSNGFYKATMIPEEYLGSLFSAWLLGATPSDIEDVPTSRPVCLVHISEPTQLVREIKSNLSKLGWDISEQRLPHASEPNQLVLILDELAAPILSGIDHQQWEGLKGINASGNPILWVTTGSQMRVTLPDNAMIHGFARSVRNEDPSISFTTLDVESSSSSATVEAIDQILKSITRSPPKSLIENEYVERNGTIFVNRILGDDLINQAEKADKHGAELITGNLHNFKGTVRLQSERVGTLDSLHYTEISTGDIPLDHGCVEVELYAAGLNFKDVAVSMGIVPENQHLLGLEGAGLIRRVSKSGASKFKIGERVLVFKKGTFGNRVIATVERTHHIPDWMSFEEASTLASVYLTSLYSIYDLAGTQRGHRVLIHSASGGLGIASIQICKYIGAEIFATVGTDAKRDFLVETFGIPRANILNSRNTSFAKELMRLTNGHGVDVILNSLTGSMLDMSWRCVAKGGTMVELGKRDMLDRNYLSMEPFGRNASYRCFDMSHEHVSDELIARLLSDLMKLIDEGHVKPISPITAFPFEDVSGAFHYMRGASHMGKIVISNGDLQQEAVPIQVRPAARTLSLPQESAILIVGGLKGLCGSLAVYLARMGARHLVILSRSGYKDERSESILKELKAENCQVDLSQGDVSSIDDVRRTFRSSTVPIGGVIQGAMVLRDKIYTSMTITEFHEAIACKVKGTWNLHNVALEEKLDLEFFSMLSSVSGVVGQKGQANYAAGNTFLDAFAYYRQQLGLRAASVDLGAIEDVGYMHEHSDIMARLDMDVWTPINENLFHKTVRFSIMQQVSPINIDSSAQLITSIRVPQPPGSTLLRDARFGNLVFGDSDNNRGSGKDDKSKAIQAFFLLFHSDADMPSLLSPLTDIVNLQFMSTLRLSEPMEPAKPLSSYGLDSLSAVEFRNWVRLELGAELTTLDITSASSLISLCEKILSKIPKVTNGTS